MLGDARSFVWTVTRDGVKGAVLPDRARIEAAAAPFVAAVGAPPSAADRQRSDRLMDLIVKPIASHLNRPRLVFVVDGILARVPFAALADPNRRGGEPLIADHEVVYAPSGSVVALLRADDRPARATKTVAVFADPVYSPLDVRVNGHSGEATTAKSTSTVPELTRALEDVEGGAADLSRLIGSRREAAAIAALTPENARRVATDFGASRAAASDPKLREYRVLHFATHALINTVHPELSGIVLSLVDPDGKPQDGFLRLHDIYSMDLSAQLVVLSACRTGLGREIRGEGLIGLTRGFLYAGAQRVVGSLWQVDDRATAELMKRFYTSLLGPQPVSPAAALAAAQRSIRAEPQWQAPYYWAGFVLQGDWK
jgi:CHAT domain-containing protein